jgi:phosphonate transport system permease protein
MQAAASLLAASVQPSCRFRRRIVLLAATTALVAGGLFFLQIGPSALAVDVHFLTGLIKEMFPPNLRVLWIKQGLWKSMLQTLAMAFFGTISGTSIAFFLSLLAATNTTPSVYLRPLVRMVLAAERCTPNFLVLLVMMVAVGIGPFAAMLTLCIGSIGTFGKLFADAIEQVDPGPGEAIAAVGASPVQTIRYAILPQVAPSIVANIFYAFDVNLRLAVMVGVFGGGGLGFELHVARSVLRYKDMCAFLVLIMILINGAERIADYVRGRLIARGTELR